ncbi:MAG: amidohydrolase family protein, partial [Proteobacteria bacterium]|nr:amidohydrolase family protein [Pseudomonadota bacterium]
MDNSFFDDRRLHPHQSILSFQSKTGYNSASGMQTFDLNPPEIVRAARFMTMRPDDSLFCDGAMLVDNGLVFVIGSFHDLKKTYPDLPVNDLGDVTLVPGLLNAHCHLEMSHLLGRVEPGLGFDGWIKNIGRASLYELDRSDVELAIKQMRDSGTCFVGDISTRNVETIAGILEDSGFFFICFAEHIFFSPPEPDQEFVPDGFFDMGAYSAAGHALHTTNAATLQAIKAQTMELGLPFSIHL